MKNKKILFSLLIVMVTMIGLKPTMVKADTWSDFTTNLNSSIESSWSVSSTSNSVTLKSSYKAANYAAATSPKTVGTATSTSYTFTYNPTTGVLSLNYVAPQDPSEAQVLAKAVTYVMTAVAKTKGYNADKFLTYMYKGYESQIMSGASTANFSTTGLSVNIADYVYNGDITAPTDDGDGAIIQMDKIKTAAGKALVTVDSTAGTASVKGQIKVLYFTAFSVDLTNGVPTYNESSVVRYTNIKEAIIGLCVIPTGTTTPIIERPTPTPEPTPTPPPAPAPEPTKTVKVPDTAAFISQNIYIAAIVLLALGTLVIGNVLMKKNR